MKLYSLRATHPGEDTVIEHQRLSITALMPIAKALIYDDWQVTLYPVADLPPPPTKPEEMR